jgi:DNA (cytosine-5)-methyltransferase 1
MRIGSLFSGIGGLELGLERAGLGPVVWQVERDSFCRSVLRKHWPSAERFCDVREATGLHAPACDLDDDCRCPIPPDRLRPVDVICGGFPCQDVANHGSRLGLDGARSGLWSEYRRIVGELRPEWVVIENVEALRRRGLGVVLGDLAALGYDAEWQTVRAADVGAPHGRARLFVVAYARSERRAELGPAHYLDWDLARRNVADRRRASFPPGARRRGRVGRRPDRRPSCTRRSSSGSWGSRPSGPRWGSRKCRCSGLR